MSVRTAELVMAIFLALCSVGLMVKSAELNIGWVPERGPGSGAWPFWLSAGMLLCCLATLYRWFRGITPESRNTSLYMTSDTVVIVGISAGAILFLLAATHWIGLYASLVLFLLFYLKFIGRHSWLVTIALTIGIPIFIFCLFEWALKIPLPKAITEPLFYPIYDLMYS
ncbi:MAG: tripartite tricarboxylate transporter TctB family protein [Gammaproteobacteria bacterium]|nr:tripartite tricarboxylate transporter TctB family protein [Gammaproteobacteria bacterium]